MVCIVRLRLPAAWTPEEDARLERLAKENGFRHWHRVARQMPGRSHGLCRDRWRNHLARTVYHRAFTAGDDAELARLHRRYGGRWKHISRAFYGRTSGVLKKRWKELRRDAAAKNSAKKVYCCPPALRDHEDLEMEPELSSPPMQHPQADVLAAGFSSCSLCCGSMDPRTGSRALGFACMAVEPVHRS